MRSFTGNRIAGERDGLKAGHWQSRRAELSNRYLGPPERDMARVDDDLRADLGRRRVTRDIGKPARATGASAYFDSAIWSSRLRKRAIWPCSARTSVVSPPTVASNR